VQIRTAQDLGSGVVLDDRARIVLGLRRGQCALRPARRLGCQLGRPLQEHGRCGDAAAALGPVGRALELGRHVLVRPGRRLRPMPGTAIGIDVGSVASASASCTRRRSSDVAAR